MLSCVKNGAYLVQNKDKSDLKHEVLKKSNENYSSFFSHSSSIITVTVFAQTEKETKVMFNQSKYLLLMEIKASNYNSSQYFGDFTK
ncbi:MAG: hypothetical protein OEL84_03150 [Nitrosopumilus sp.]|nr:hypothetical protein [Nitrosopumilus sp.]